MGAGAVVGRWIGCAGGGELESGHRQRSRCTMMMAVMRSWTMLGGRSAQMRCMTTRTRRANRWFWGKAARGSAPVYVGGDKRTRSGARIAARCGDMGSRYVYRFFVSITEAWRPALRST